MLGDVDILKTIWYAQIETDETVELLFFAIHNGVIRDCTNAVALICGFTVGDKWNSGISFDKTGSDSAWCAEIVANSLAEKLYERRSQFDANLWKVRML
jgi:hypothetical protein